MQVGLTRSFGWLDPYSPVNENIDMNRSSPPPNRAMLLGLEMEMKKMLLLLLLESTLLVLLEPQGPSNLL